jgi:hypothetical protein
MLAHGARPRAAPAAAKAKAGGAKPARAREDEHEYHDSSGEDDDALELACDIRLEQQRGGAALSCRQQKRTTLSFDRAEGVLVAKVQGADIRIAMTGPKARVTVHCSAMHQGKIAFRDLTRNLSVLVSNAMPQRLLEFQQALKRALNAPKTPPKWKPASPTSPWSRAQKRRLALSPSTHNKRSRATPATVAKAGGAQDAVRLSPEQEAVVCSTACGVARGGRRGGGLPGEARPPHIFTYENPMSSHPHSPLPCSPPSLPPLRPSLSLFSSPQPCL